MARKKKKTEQIFFKPEEYNTLKTAVYLSRAVHLEDMESLIASVPSRGDALKEHEQKESYRKKHDRYLLNTSLILLKIARLTNKEDGQNDN